jgi:rhamnogalacturonan endolyase
MRIRRSPLRSSFARLLSLLVVAMSFTAHAASAAAASAEPAAPVTLTRTAAGFTLANGILSVQIDAQSAAILSIEYKDIAMLGVGDRENGYWSMPGTQLHFGPHPAVTILDDPSANNGERATISCRFTYDGGPQSVPANVDIHYSLGRGSSAVYLEAVWDHQPDFPQLTFPVGRFAVKLNDNVFDWMSVDARRNMEMITAYDWNHGTQMNLKEARRMNTGILKGQVEHKYDYSAIQWETPAYGWSSTKQQVGIWVVTANPDYMSGGPTKLELVTHRDATFTSSLTAPAPPTLLYVWKGPHYGATDLVVPKGEQWTKTIGPFLLYCNSGATPDAMWHDALAEAAHESSQWPFRWAVAPGYPAASELGGLTGKIVLHDPHAPKEKMTNLRVGLTHPDYPLPSGEMVDWQHDGKFYQYWSRGDAQGNFSIAHIRPGTYTLHAFADGVLGEYAQANVTIAPGKSASAGRIVWTPVRYGRQLWDIGIPDRTSGEFLNGDHYWRWGIYNEYPKQFPHDVDYVIGKSDYHKDWNMMQVPRATDDSGSSRGSATTWTIEFNVDRQQHGLATLRLAFAGTEARSLTVAVNSKPVGILTGLPNTSVIHRDSDRGFWEERDVPFDASLLRNGQDKIELTIPAGPVMNGVQYDYLRLEVDAATPAPPPASLAVPSQPKPRQRAADTQDEN